MPEPATARPARDVVDTVLGFARTLRHAGVTASPDRVESMLVALGALDVLDPGAVYWAGRTTLVRQPIVHAPWSAAEATIFELDQDLTSAAGLAVDRLGVRAHHPGELVRRLDAAHMRGWPASGAGIEDAPGSEKPSASATARPW